MFYFYNNNTYTKKTVAKMNTQNKERQWILVADDSEMNRLILTDILGDEFEILEAGNG